MVWTSGFADSGIRLLFPLMQFLTAFIFLESGNADLVTQVSYKYEMHKYEIQVVHHLMYHPVEDRRSQPLAVTAASSAPGDG